MSKSSKHLRLLLLMSLFSALSIVFGKLLAFNIGDTVRISFESLPILFAGVFLGPLCGAVVGAVADLLGCLLVGYAINPIITLGAVAIGLLSGVIFRIAKPLPMAVRLFFAVFIAHIFGSVLIKTVGLIVYYESPVHLFFVRTYYLGIAAVEGALLLAIAKSNAVRALDRMLDRTEANKEDTHR